MAIQKSLSAKNVLLILYGIAMINQGMSQDDEDYSANVELEDISSKPNNNYFEVQIKPDVVLFLTTQDVKSSLKVHVVDYKLDENREKQKISSSPLCEELTKNQESSELKNKILSTFLFPRQQRCPVKQDRVRVPESKMLSFNYDSTEISCDQWKYRIELVSLYNEEPLAALTVNLKMEKKNECASSK